MLACFSIVREDFVMLPETSRIGHYMGPPTTCVAPLLVMSYELSITIASTVLVRLCPRPQGKTTDFVRIVASHNLIGQNDSASASIQRVLPGSHRHTSQAHTGVIVHD